MRNSVNVLVIALACSAVFAEPGVDKSLSHADICQRYAASVVRINTSRGSGTGFIVSTDGYILTAAHVVIDTQKTGQIDGAITVTLPNGSIHTANEVLPLTPELVGRDFALLKVGGTNPKLPNINLAPITLADIDLGSDVTIIGFPLSAVDIKSDSNIEKKFCLSGTIANFGEADVAITTTNPDATKSTTTVKVDVIYFQGPSVKGLSGSPIISNKSGHVIAILTSKLTGISQSLAATRDTLISGSNGEFVMGNVAIGQTLLGIINTLDLQLANGLGAGTGIEDARLAMEYMVRQENQKKNKLKLVNPFHPPKPN
jgi:S1-C subfamily serine protease